MLEKSPPAAAAAEEREPTLRPPHGPRCYAVADHRNHVAMQLGQKLLGIGQTAKPLDEFQAYLLADVVQLAFASTLPRRSSSWLDVWSVCPGFEGGCLYRVHLLPL